MLHFDTFRVDVVVQAHPYLENREYLRVAIWVNSHWLFANSGNEINIEALAATLEERAYATLSTRFLGPV